MPEAPGAVPERHLGSSAGAATTLLIPAQCVRPCVATRVQRGGQSSGAVAFAEKLNQPRQPLLTHTLGTPLEAPHPNVEPSTQGARLRWRWREQECAAMEK